MRYVCQYKRGGKINIGTVGVITPAQAREKAVEILNDFNKGIDPKSKRGANKPKTLEEFFEHEYKSWVLTHHKQGGRTIASIIRCFNKLFSKPLEEITPSIIEQWRIKRLNDGISNATLNRDIGTLKALFTKAVEWEFIKKHPLKNLKLSKIDRAPKVRYLSFDEEKNLRQALLEREEQLIQDRKRGNEWRQSRGYELLPKREGDAFCDYLAPMVLISINTGLRQGELFHLTWEMIDLQERSIIIAGQITKNSSSRYIPLNNEAYKIIKQLHEKSDSKKGLVFLSKDNKPFNNIKRSWTTILIKAQITEFRWHDLRHHFASKLVMAGIDLNTVRELLGHSDIKMTLRYAHLAPEHKIKAVNKINWID